MSKPVRTATADLYVDYGNFVVRDYGGEDRPTPRLAAANGLLGADSSGAVVLTGVATGWVTVTLEVLDTEPGSIELDGWDEVSEVSIELEEGDLLVHDLGSDPPTEFFELGHIGPGTYRLRVCARGRDTAPGSRANTPVEFYQLAIWPAPESPETVYKQTDAFGHEVRTKWKRP